METEPVEGTNGLGRNETTAIVETNKNLLKTWKSKLNLFKGLWLVMEEMKATISEIICEY